MMDYGMFRDAVKEKFLSYMPGKYQGMDVKIEPVKKVNRRLDGLSLRKAGKGNTMSPSICVNKMYDGYLESGDLQAVLQDAAKEMDEAFRQMPQMPAIDICTAKDNIIFQLVNTKQNEDMLQDMPHREFQDLSIIYRWVVNADDEAISSTVIHNSLAKELGMVEGDLFNAAAENTRRILPPVVKSANEVMREMLLDRDMPLSVADHIIGAVPSEEGMWIITNEQEINGAASMLYEDVVHKLAESLESDLYILPSSLHEVMAVPVKMGEPEALAQMVKEINMNQVELEERLSNQVYHYDKSLRKFALATDTPDKRLDGMAAGQETVKETAKMGGQ